MPKWSKFESDKLKEVRERLGGILLNRPQFPEVVGDRKLLRFIRGHEYNVDKACEMITKFLQWRDSNGVDEIREKIVSGELDHPSKFPRGAYILKAIPQLVIAPYALDRKRAPICVETYKFRPPQLLKELSIPEYINFLIHCLEYKSLILEQMSEEREEEILRSLSEDVREYQLSDVDHDVNPYGVDPYGIIMGITIIRDLDGLGFDHIGSKGQEIIKAVVNVASDNYPEMMTKCHIINAPWLFNACWYFVKGLLAARTIEKVSLSGGNFKAELLKDIDEDNIPEMVGGRYRGAQEYFSYPFNRAYFCPTPSGAEAGAEASVEASPEVGNPSTNDGEEAGTEANVESLAPAEESVAAEPTAAP